MKRIRTTVQDKAAPCPLDHVNRVFHALHRTGSGYRTSPTSASGRDLSTLPSSSILIPVALSAGGSASFVLDALEQAVHERRPVHRSGLMHHSDRGSQYVSIRYTERLAGARIEHSVGSVGDSLTTHSPRRSTISTRPVHPSNQLGHVRGLLFDQLAIQFRANR